MNNASPIAKSGSKFVTVPVLAAIATGSESDRGLLRQVERLIKCSQYDYEENL